MYLNLKQNVHFCAMYWQTLHQLLLKNKNLYIAYTFLLCLAATLQLQIGQYSLSLVINGIHNQYLDYFFTYITHVGDGLFAIPIIVFVVWLNKKEALKAIAVLYGPALITQVLKRLIFSDSFRPIRHLKDFNQLHWIPGLEIHELNSFPSGHSTSAFALAFLLALMLPNKKWGFLFLIPALAVALSRVYLLQHFFEDVFAGAIIGGVAATLIYAIFETQRAKQH